MSASKNLLIYLLRRDLRVTDNPIFHHLATNKDHGFTHLLPVYIFPANQVEISGFLNDPSTSSPYPEARSQVGGFWRCGPHRARFIAQSVWDLKSSLESIGSGLTIRVGMPADVVENLIDGFENKGQKVGAVWLTSEEAVEEKREERDIERICSQRDIGFKKWVDEKYFIDDHDTGLDKPSELPDIFTTYRKMQEPLRERPRSVLPKPDNNALPLFPDSNDIPASQEPFQIPTTLKTLEQKLLQPLGDILPDPPKFPEKAKSAHPFDGGEKCAFERVKDLCKSGNMSTYKDTRNNMVGTDFSTKLSAYLALGCLSARQIHAELLKLEDGQEDEYKGANGYGKGENEGTKAVRFELLWRDYMRLCTRKFGHRLFRLSGFRDGDANYQHKWKSASRNNVPHTQQETPQEIAHILGRFWNGTTGMGLIDASQRELFLTGYTSNRARQNIASFLAKHLGIDWRYGAEWYECMLVDYDVSSNWANWQYVSGVGNDPRGEARIFNPVKQALDYDKEGEYVKMWVPELQSLKKIENVFQAWTANDYDRKRAGISDMDMVTNPIKKIHFSMDKKPKRPGKANKSNNHRGAPPRQKGSADSSPPSHNGGQKDDGGGGEATDAKYSNIPGGPKESRPPRRNGNQHGRGNGGFVSTTSNRYGSSNSYSTSSFGNGGDQQSNGSNGWSRNDGSSSRGGRGWGQNGGGPFDSRRGGFGNNFGGGNGWNSNNNNGYNRV